MPKTSELQPGAMELMEEILHDLLLLGCRKVNSELCPLVDKHSDCKFLLLGRRISFYNICDHFCVCKRDTVS